MPAPDTECLRTFALGKKPSFVDVSSSIVLSSYAVAVENAAMLFHRKDIEASPRNGIWFQANGEQITWKLSYPLPLVLLRQPHPCTQVSGLDEGSVFCSRFHRGGQSLQGSSILAFFERSGY